MVADISPSVVRLMVISQQEAQLSQRDRATLRVIEYFAKSLKVLNVIRMTLLSRACVSP